MSSTDSGILSRRGVIAGIRARLPQRWHHPRPGMRRTRWPAEEPDAREVIKLIKADGRTAVALPGNIRDEACCQSWWQTPVGQLELAPVYVELASSQATYITGQVYGTSGGSGNP